jgi:AcrR family transcriptional regulator
MAGGRRPLTRERVLDEALRLVDRDGLAGLSMRRLGRKLGVEAMSLYKHVAGKADLLDGVVSRVFEDIAVPDPGLPWPERIRALGAASFAAFRDHPAVVRAVAGGLGDPRTPGALRVIDAILGALLDAGLDEQRAARGYRSMLGLAIASVLVSSPEPPVAGQREPVAETFRRTAETADLRHLRRVLPAMLGDGCAAAPGFDFELDLLIAGFHAAGGVTAGHRTESAADRTIEVSAPG